MEMQKLGLGIMKWYLMVKWVTLWKILIEKEECVNHVQKRMGLRELATKEKRSY